MSAFVRINCDEGFAVTAREGHKSGLVELTVAGEGKSVTLNMTLEEVGSFAPQLTALADSMMKRNAQRVAWQRLLNP
jgi:hypothetical protein